MESNVAIAFDACPRAMQRFLEWMLHELDDLEVVELMLAFEDVFGNRSR